MDPKQVRDIHVSLNSHSSSLYKEIWRAPIWRAPVPNKVRNFLWRLAKNNLPTLEKGTQLDNLRIQN